MTSPTPSQPPQRDDVRLTSDDETALDRAWETITDAEIEASIAWLSEQQPAPEQPELQQHDQKEKSNG